MDAQRDYGSAIDGVVIRIPSIETLQGLFGLALIVGLFAWYFKDRRARLKGHEPAPAAEPIAESAPAEDQAGARRSGSPNWGAPIVLCLLLLGAVTHRGSWWGYLWQALYLGFVAVAIYSTFAPKELADEQKRRPGTTRKQHYLKLGLPYVFVPIVAWVLAVPLGLSAFWVLPAVPWVVLIVIGFGTLLFQKREKP